MSLEEYRTALDCPPEPDPRKTTGDNWAAMAEDKAQAMIERVVSVEALGC